MPDTPARGPHVVGFAELRELLATTPLQVIEVLEPEQFAWAHLPGARNVPLARLGSRLPEDVDPDVPVAVYCHDSL